jgi:hypothetical protein
MKIQPLRGKIYAENGSFFRFRRCSSAVALRAMADKSVANPDSRPPRALDSKKIPRSYYIICSADYTSDGVRRRSSPWRHRFRCRTEEVPRIGSRHGHTISRTAGTAVPAERLAWWVSCAWSAPPGLTRPTKTYPTFGTKRPRQGRLSQTSAGKVLPRPSAMEWKCSRI